MLQTYALLGSNDVSKQALFSICISASAIAFTSTSISVDFDTDPQQRSNAPAFYGYTPSKHRTRLFFIMMFISASHALMKVLACSLMMRLNQTWLWTYLLGDMCLFFLFKFIRGELRYFLPLDGVVGLVATTVIRIVVKTVNDFVLVVQFRHPMEMSGMYWTLSFIMNQVFCFISVYLYGKLFPGVNDGMIEMLWLITISLFFFSILSSVVFLLLINHEFWPTFFSVQTGKQYVVYNYENATTDALKFQVFIYHRMYYDDIQEEIMKWYVFEKNIFQPVSI